MTTINLPISAESAFSRKFDHDLRAAPALSTLQINIGYVCNLACRHCHVESSPARTAPGENMDRNTAERVVEWALQQPSIRTIDLTGGSPEMNPNFRWMVESFHHAGLHVMDRCNPTIIMHVDRATGASYGWVPEFLAGHQVEVVASMPCYLETNVDHQRGRGSYHRSVEGLLRLNEVGYGREPNLRLNLVYNPDGAHLPPPQESLRDDYRRELKERFGLMFNDLWTITNMPIRRWRHELQRAGKLEEYMTLLVNAFNPATIEGLMCRRQISIDPQGFLYDCDFNQAIGLRTPHFQRERIWEVSMDDLASRVIATDDHCYGCTAGCGSSCGGALV